MCRKTNESSGVTNTYKMVTCLAGENKRPDDPISQSYAKDLKTYIITLKFSDFSLIPKGIINSISYGGELFEFRADLLQDLSTGEIAVPSLECVKTQSQILQQLTSLPIPFGQSHKVASFLMELLRKRWHL
jgi:hypothetical protein